MPLVPPVTRAVLSVSEKRSIVVNNAGRQLPTRIPPKLGVAGRLLIAAYRSTPGFPSHITSSSYVNPHAPALSAWSLSSMVVKNQPIDIPRERH